MQSLLAPMRTKTQTFCVDATNVVRRAYGYGGPQFRAQEESDGQHLIMALADVCQRHEDLVALDVVFDGPWRAGSQSLPGNLRLRFAREGGADEMILDRVRALRHGGERVTVVTSDSELADLVREEGGRLLTPRSGGIDGVAAAIEARLRA